MISNSPFEAYINGPSHHTLHHLYFTVNYGQYFTFADKFNASFRAPATGEDPLNAILAKSNVGTLNNNHTKLVKTVTADSGSDGESSTGSGVTSDDDSGFEEIDTIHKSDGLKME